MAVCARLPLRHRQISESSVKYIEQVRKILTLPCNAGDTLKLKKGLFLAKTIDFLGHIIRPKRLKIASHTIGAIYKFLTLTSLTELRILLELCSVFRHYVINIAKITVSFNKRLQKDQPAWF